MEEQTKVPAEIAAIIELKRLSMQAKQEEDERQSREARATTILAGRTKLRELITETLEPVPEWLHQYDATEAEWSDDDLVNLNHGYHGNKLTLVFRIPGLAPIQFEPNRWRSAGVYFKHNYEYGDSDKPTLAFTNGSYWRTDLEFTLGEAEMNFNEFSAKMAEYNQKLEDAQICAEQQEERDADANARHVTEQAASESEERILFNLFKDDPVAISLMKAFLMINQERTTFNTQLEDANETMYSIEQRWTHRAEDLRRQAEHAQRMADEERDRVSSLQSDLDDAEGKLKKAQRGW